MDIKRLVGVNIRAARKVKGLTQFQLAERSGLSADFVGKVERGTTSPSIESLKHIADALSVPLRDLFEGEGEAFPAKEALVHLNRLCRERKNEEVELILRIAQLIFEQTRDRSRTP
ncbi:MAG: helix-turn-helix domain-containing protein [Candidatus Entotheonellia bacterium]